MLRKLIAPLAGFALLAGLAGTARAADPVAGKATITVKVVDSDGKAVDGANVSLTMGGGGKKNKAAAATPADPKLADDPKPTDPTPPADGGMGKRPKPLQTTTSDAQGAASFKDVADGSYVVMARMKGMGNGREKVTVTGGKDESVTVTIKKKAA